MGASRMVSGKAAARRGLATVSTPLGDGCWLARMRGRDALGKPFAYDLELLSQEPDLQASRLLGQALTVTVAQQGDNVRFVHGIATRFERTGTRGRYAAYQVTLRPSLWLLSRTTDCRIFPRASV